MMMMKNISGKISLIVVAFLGLILLYSFSVSQISSTRNIFALTKYLDKIQISSIALSMRSVMQSDVLLIIKVFYRY